MTDLFLFRHDLRLHDNPGLDYHADARALLCVYVREQPRPWRQTLSPGQQRLRFQEESIAALQQRLRQQGQELLVLDGDPLRLLPGLVDHFSVRRVGLARAPGTFERQLVERLDQRLSIPVMEHDGNTLYGLRAMRQLPDLPPHYTPFRERAAALPMRALLAPPTLPPPPAGLQAPTFKAGPASPHPAYNVRGGEANGQRRLQDWLFRERAVDHYQATRNDLEGLFSSSWLSPWLANGSVSVRAAEAALARYETQHGYSDDTEHLRRELLWREFFHWRALREDRHLFLSGGASGRHCRRCFEPRSFARWCAGDTDYPLVNALMHQLVETGWMSNRGRQIAASCLINEMGGDWRYGAAFFEKHLIDFDVASNYGNWQYIAGVGADPRGGRHFNLQQQAARYDHDGLFTRRWDGFRPPQPEHVVDAADWPITLAPQGLD